MSLTVGSLFSGAGGFDLGFERAGFDVRWQVEIDRHAVAVLARHWPAVRRYGDVRTVRGDAVEPVDVVIGGFPCQDVSVAGRRAGLAGARTGLFWEAVRIVEEMRDATHGRYPALVVLENVPGLLSAGVSRANPGGDFALVLQGLGELGAAVAWRILDARFFGVPQRRRRVFIVADFAEPDLGERRAAEVLALADGLSGDSAAGRTTGQAAAAGARDGAAPGGGGEPFVIKGAAIGRSPHAGPQRGEVINDGTCYTLTTNEVHVVARPNLVERRVAPFYERQVTSPDNRSTVAFDAPAPTLNGGAGLSAVIEYAPETATAVQASAIGFHLTQNPIDATEATPSLGAGNASGCSSLGGLLGEGARTVIRRLTPREAERLMAFPDDWTSRGADGRELADGPRYRLCGNAVVVTVAAWLAERARAALLPAERGAELSEAAG